MEFCHVVDILRRLALTGLSLQTEEGLQVPSDLVSQADVQALLTMMKSAEASQKVWEMIRQHEVSMIGLKR